jgi:anti-sigma B factor antagonist
VQIAKCEADQILKLSGAIQINVVDELRAALLGFLCTTSRPVVDLSEVTECDTAALQLLVSASRTAKLSIKPLELVGLSAAVREASAALGLSDPEPPADSVAGRPHDVVGALLPDRGSEHAI